MNKEFRDIDSVFELIDCNNNLNGVSYNGVYGNRYDIEDKFFFYGLTDDYLSECYHQSKKSKVNKLRDSLNDLDVFVVIDFCKDSLCDFRSVNGWNFDKEMLDAHQKDNVALKFVLQIKALDKNEGTHATIKEVYKIFHDVLHIESKQLIDSILKHVANDDISLSVLVAFLTVTLPIKNELIHRKSVFEKAQKKAIITLGVENVNKSIFNHLS